ncbi:alpha/beta fold hydrolase [Bradyrhizobium sp. WD16]|uniref:alpha/beta fold hydrolase n=1 Tax=Bradyrhizobium sp. WD16 TaxID=1521768 RepID=UPI0020A2FEBB|nr:alpha/beta hydrolase [Bradyrhizobium sp. WD16]UTD28883.1 alpha/beta hydrolase [Bradyrhizobium sp. WD16]
MTVTSLASLGRDLRQGLLALAMAFAAAFLPAQSRAAEIGLPNIVLVHGAFADGSSWSDVIPLLQAKGYHVTAVQIPLTSLADDVAATRRALERQTGDVLLVGHSWAGAVVTEAGNGPNVKGLVYLSALVPDAGGSVAELLQKRNSPMHGLTPDKNGFVWLDDPTAYAHVMAADVPPARVAQLAAIEKPIVASVFGDKVTDAAWTNRPSWYLVTEGDNALPTAAQTWLSQHIGATTKTIASSHMSMISHPDVVADFIAGAASKAGK